MSVDPGAPPRADRTVAGGKETTGPAGPVKAADLTLPRLLAVQAERFGDDAVAIREKAYGIWQAISWRTYWHSVRAVGQGLLSLGFRRGETAALITDNHAEWLFAELGVQALGGVTVNLFTSAVADELANQLDRIGASVVFAQDQEQTDKLLERRDRLGGIRRVITIDPTGMRDALGNPWLMSFRDLVAGGEREDETAPERFDQALARGRARDTALMILTSGTTGVPKLAMLTHGNLIAMGRQWTEALDLRAGENWLSLSPPAWIVDQMWGMGVALASGMIMNFPETPETVPEDFREIGPSVIITASRFWEELASRIRVRMTDAGWLKKRLFVWGEAVGKAVVACRSEKRRPGFWLEARRRLAEYIVYRPLLDRVGCARLRSAYTGGHPISPDVIRFFRAIGLNLKQCYGLTEAGGIFQLQPDDEVKMETVGKPLPGTAVKIGPDDEVLVRHDGVFAGYCRDFQATEAAFADGWLRTGDAGLIDADGHLVIIGRKEEIIRNKSGQAFSPDFIETRLKFSPYIKEAVIFGEGRPFITALINIDFGNTGAWAEERMIPYTTYLDLSAQTPVQELILREIREVNKQLPELMRVRRFILLYKLLDADDDELTRTGKVRRRFVYGLYLHLIEGMYGTQETLQVTGKVQYRDGRVGEIETTVRIMAVKEAGEEKKTGR